MQFQLSNHCSMQIETDWYLFTDETMWHANSSKIVNAMDFQFDMHVSRGSPDMAP